MPAIPPGVIFLYLIFILNTVCLILTVYALLRGKYALFYWIKWITATSCLLYLIVMLTLARLITVGSFEYKLVYETANSAMPLHQKLSGLWANQNSSLNFWCFLLMLANMLSLWIAETYQPRKGKLVTALLFLVLILVFMVPVVFILNPFARLWVDAEGIVQSSVWIKKSALIVVPENGVGLNPSLRHPAMLIHPPLLYLGLIGFFIPYAHAISALFSEDSRVDWQGNIRQVSLFAWACLTAGMALGSWWAYTILGWGGYWGWDAVEIAGLIPWLLSIAFVHSLMRGGKSGENSLWPYLLIALVFLFTLMGVFITRSGILESVHAYSKGPVGPVLSILLLGFTVLNVWLLIRGRKRFSRAGKVSWLSLSHILLIFLSLTYFTGQTMPITSRVFRGLPSRLPAWAYEAASLPFIFLLLAGIHQQYFNKDKERKSRMKTIILLVLTLTGTLMFIYWIPTNLLPIVLFASLVYLFSRFLLKGAVAIIRIINQRKAVDQANHRILRRLNGYLIHFGFVLMLMGMLGVENGARQNDIALAVGEHAAAFGDLSITSVSVQQYRDDEPRQTYENALDVGVENKQVVRLTPRIDVYERTDIRTSTPAVHTGLWQDVQVVLLKWGGTGQRSRLRVLEFPLASWIWTGCGLMVAGTCFTLFKEKSS